MGRKLCLTSGLGRVLLLLGDRNRAGRSGEWPGRVAGVVGSILVEIAQEGPQFPYAKMRTAGSFVQGYLMNKVGEMP